MPEARDDAVTNRSIVRRVRTASRALRQRSASREDDHGV
jgi:hypothetical protein